MSRIRTIKPEFYRHEGLQDLEIKNPGAYPMLVFQGLWSQCDRNGVFQWRPRQLKLDILPFLPFDMATTLLILEESNYLIRYFVDKNEYGYIPTFCIHQRLSGKEASKEGEKFPLPEATVKQQGSDREATGKTCEATGKISEIPNVQEREREREREREKERNSSERKVPLQSEREVFPSVISIPLVCQKDGPQAEFDITQPMIDSWSQSFPAVDVLQELRSIREWNLSNPTKRKTPTGIRKHISTWLDDKQNKGGSARQRAISGYDGRFQTIVSTGDPKLDISMTNAANFVQRRMERIQNAK